MYKRKFNFGDKVIVKKGKHAGKKAEVRYVTTTWGRVKYEIVGEDGRRIGWSFYAHELDFAENKSKEKIKIDETIRLNEINFEEVANYIIKEKLWGHFVENTGQWISISPEDFGIDTIYGGYVTNGMHINKNGKSSCGTKMIKWVPQNSLNHTKDLKENVKVPKKDVQKEKDFVWMVTSTFKWNYCYNYIIA